MQYFNRVMLLHLRTYAGIYCMYIQYIATYSLKCLQVMMMILLFNGIYSWTISQDCEFLIFYDSSSRWGCKTYSLLFSKNGDVDPAVKALEARQDVILRKLYELKATVDGLAKTVTTPDADLDLTVSSSISSHSCSSTAFKGVTDLDTVLGKVRKWE